MSIANVGRLLSLLKDQLQVLASDSHQPSTTSDTPTHLKQAQDTLRLLRVRFTKPAQLHSTRIYWTEK